MIIFFQEFIISVINVIPIYYRPKSNVVWCRANGAYDTVHRSCRASCTSGACTACIGKRIMKVFQEWNAFYHMIPIYFQHVPFSERSGHRMNYSDGRRPSKSFGA